VTDLPEDVQARVDALFDLPGAEFVAARDALAKEVAKEHKPAVRALRRPSKIAEAVNRVVRDGDPSELLAAGPEAVAAAAKALGHAAPAPIRADVVMALRLAALDPALRDELAAGRLVQTPEPSGFDLALEAGLPERAPAARTAKAAKPKPKAAKPKATAKPKAAAKPKPKVDRARERAIQRAQLDVEEREEAVEAARAALAEAEQALAAARDALDAARS
jgi:stage V sporulation protein SpoVS